MSIVTVKVPNQGKVTAGLASVLVVAANAGRQQLWLTNPSDTMITVTIGRTAVLNEGIDIPASGGIVIDTDISTLDIFCITSAANKTLSFCEVTN